LLEFVAQETNIPINQLMLYVYDAIFNENLIRRNDFELIPISKQYLARTFSDYTNNFKKMFLFFYIYAPENSKILNTFPMDNEEFLLNNKIDKSIHISNKL
jgi:hypothetical protein